MPGIPVTWLNEFNVATTSAGDPDIIQLANGNILVTWTSSDPARPGASGDSDIIGQIYDPLGVAVGGAFRVNQGFFADAETDSDSAATTSGGFITVYEDVETTGTPLRFNIYDASGAVTFTNTIESDSNSGTQPNFRDPHVAVSSSTSALVVYQFQDASGTRIAGRIVDPSTGTVGAQISLIGFNLAESQPDVAVLSNGNYVIACVGTTGGDSRIDYRIVDSAGANVLSASFIAATNADGFSDYEPSVTALNGGGFVIAYTDIDANDTDVTVAIFNAAGTQTGTANVILPNSATNDTNEASVTGLSDGSFIVIVDDDQANNMVATHFSAAGASLGNFVFSGPGTDPVVTDLGDGRFSVAWQSLDTTGGLRMEILDTRDFVNDPAVYTPEPNWQVGTVGNDTFTTDDDADVVHGWTGNDDITQNVGSGAPNEYYGDAGNDILRVNTAIDTDKWDGGANTDTINWGTAAIANGAIFDLAAGTAKQGAATETMVGFENIVGSSFNDTLRGTSGVNVMKGSSGDDTIRGGAGGDDLDGGSGVNTLDYTTSSAGVKIDISANTASGGDAQGDDILHFQNVSGSNFNDAIYGNSAVNVLRGYAGVDTLDGRGGNDTVYGYDGNDILRGGDGDDRVSGMVGNDSIEGNVGKDTLSGEAGADAFFYRTLGDSTIAKAGQDNILDFSHADGDKIKLSDIDAKATASGNNQFVFIGNAAFSGAEGELRYVKYATETYVYGDVNGDKSVDFAIHFATSITFVAGDFSL